MNTIQTPSPALKITPFHGHALAFTLREIHSPTSEFQSQHFNAEDAAAAYFRACATARSVVLKDPEGQIVAAFDRGR